MKFKEFLVSLEKKYIFCFSRSLAESETGLHGQSLSTTLLRYTKKGEIQALRRGIYIIIPIAYRGAGHLPLEMYIEDMMKALGKKYYVSMFNAARAYGASHHAIMKDYVTTNAPTLVDINKSFARIDFFSIQNWPKKNLVRRKFASGSYWISSPALTCVDLIKYQNQIGGADRVFGVIEELHEEINIVDLKELLTWYPFNSNLQRLGYLLELSQANSLLLDVLIDHLSLQKMHVTPLMPTKKNQFEDLNKKWKVGINVQLEGES